MIYATPAPPPSRFDHAGLAAQPLRLLMVVFTLYAAWTVPSLLPRWGISSGGFLLLAGWVGLAALALPLARGRISGVLGPTLLVAVAVLLRFAALWALWGHDAVADPLIYRQIAAAMIDGGPMIFHEPRTGVAFRALYPPLYPLFLTGIGAVAGLGQGVIWLSNLAFDLAAAALLVRIGARAGSRAGGRAAAWLYLVWPTFILASPFAQKEPLVALLVLAIALRMTRLRADTHPTPIDGAVVGALGGLLTLTQPGLLTVPLMFGLALLPVVGLRPMVALAVRSLPVLLLVMMPWWVRNALVLGRFVPLTTTGGIGLWIGNNPAATGNWMPLPPALGRLPELEQSAAAAAVARDWIVAHPADMLRLNAAKLLRAFGIEQFTLVRFGLLRPALASGHPALLFPMLQGALLATLAAATVAIGRLRTLPDGRLALLLTLAIVAQLIVFDLWFEFAERHRYVAMPFLFLLIGAAMTTTNERDATRHNAVHG
ncbi:hypothetical protein [Sphingomonas montana]|uniref:hypothetical protein n=1 Tax=Sphingomonas montana TaxID=1843236 RepID=UPI00096DDEE0|nr:hypothetical protein [Sphingomonas montana]